MTEPTQSDEIHTAAETLRALATAAHPGTWTALELPPNEGHDYPAFWVDTSYTDEDGFTRLLTVADCPWGLADATYIATLHPTIGLALAALLDALAEGHEVDQQALALARQITGESA